ncbi:integrase, catalytic region, zinc finger, CCHC-type containing protein [Tanacetum coccineum]
MSAQQDIYVAGSENHPPMLNKDNYNPWLSRLLHYAKSKPNGKLLVISIHEGPYQYRMIEEPDDSKSYISLDNCNSAKEIWLRVQQMMKGTDIGVQEKETKLLNELERFTSTEYELIESYYHQWKRFVTLVHQTKKLHDVDYQLYDYLKQNQEEVNEVRAERLARTHDPLAFMANTQTPYTYPVFHPDQLSHITYMQPTQPNNNWNQNGNNAVQNTGNQVGQNAVQNIRNQNGLIVVLGIANQNGNRNVIAARAENNGNGNNANQIRCYKCRGVGHYVRNCTVRPRIRDASYLHTQLLIAQKEESGIRL